MTTGSAQTATRHRRLNSSDMALSDADREAIRLYERYDRGDLTEREARNALGNERIEAIVEETVAFREATKRDTAAFLVDAE